MKRCVQGRFYTTAKMPKYKSISEITLEQLKLHPIVDQTVTYIYKAFKVVAEYLSSVATNDHTIRDTLSFPDLLKSAHLMIIMRIFWMI